MATPPEEQQTTDANIARVRELRNQISFLQQKYAADPTSNGGTPDTIDALQRELNGIPNSGSY